MKHTHKWLALALAGVLTLSLLAGCTGNDTPSASASSSTPEKTQETVTQTNSDALVIAEQGIFSTGGTEEEWNDRVMNVIVDIAYTLIDPRIKLK